MLDRQEEPEAGLAGPRNAIDDAAMLVDDLGNERKAKAGAARLGRHERIEQMRQKIGIDARPVVDDM